MEKPVIFVVVCCLVLVSKEYLIISSFILIDFGRLILLFRCYEFFFESIFEKKNSESVYVFNVIVFLLMCNCIKIWVVFITLKCEDTSLGTSNSNTLFSSIEVRALLV